MTTILGIALAIGLAALLQLGFEVVREQKRLPTRMIVLLLVLWAWVWIALGIAHGLGLSGPYPEVCATGAIVLFGGYRLVASRRARSSPRTGKSPGGLGGDDHS